MLGCSPETGFDCSGYVIYVFTRSGIPIPENIRHTSEFFDQFGVLVHRYRPGDLIFFSKDGRAPKHVGIVINGEEYIHSPGRNGSRVSVAQIKRETITSQFEDQLYLDNPIGFKTASALNGRWQKIF